MSPQLMPSWTLAAAAAVDDAALVDLLADLYHQQLAAEPDNEYLRLHSAGGWIANHVRTFRWYEPYLPDTGTILEWGCQHAPDSCILRAVHGDRYRLHGCDFVPADRYLPFYQFAGLAYTRLEDLVKLPYGADSFDAVIASGVLEHASMDYESLKELFRILRPGGTLVISYLPNRWSYQEWVNRTIRKTGFHRRLYGLRETCQLLRHTGFWPIHSGYHTFFWENALARLGVSRGQRHGARLLSTFLPLHWACGALCFVARKVTCM